MTGTFEVLARDADTAARLGWLHTAHGVVETPIFMPVGTQATVKGLTQRDLAGDLGQQLLRRRAGLLPLLPGSADLQEEVDLRARHRAALGDLRG